MPQLTPLDLAFFPNEGFGGLMVGVSKVLDGVSQSVNTIKAIIFQCFSG